MASSSEAFTGTDTVRFDRFLWRHPELKEREGLALEQSFYSSERIGTEDARTSVVLPDLRAFPSVLSTVSPGQGQEKTGSTAAAGGTGLGQGKGVAGGGWFKNLF